MRYWLVSIAWLVLPLAGPAAAGAFCTQLAGMTTQPRSNDDLTMSLPDGGEAVRCQTSLALSGSRSIHCGWEFPFRSDAAVQAFDTLIETVTTCGAVADTTDIGVNHPDSYDLRLFTIGSAEIGISLKDKGALDRTFVFLRVTPDG